MSIIILKSEVDPRSKSLNQDLQDGLDEQDYLQMNEIAGSVQNQ